MIWSREEWWNKAVDKANAESGFAQKGWPFSHWENRYPIFDGEVDYEQVQRVVEESHEGIEVDLSPATESAEPGPSEEAKEQPRKGGWPKGKPRGNARTILKKKGGTK